MIPDRYIQAIMQRAGLSTYADVEKAVQAVLEVLGRRITIGQADDLAASLPMDMRPYLRQNTKAESFDLDRFFAMIGEREGVDPATAAVHARAVLSVIAENVPASEVVDTFEQIPKEMRQLFFWTKEAA